ncbi:cytochrome P450 6k1-like [Leptidea sinapis]|uniref:cytochrome P450 6k1-like n=1 Tax=Leptidea sinapis TaxID=189913 RepID=UPI0021C3FFCA|nr:cytochrome P450 6k1-like [Leptidea sinapis]
MFSGCDKWEISDDTLVAQAAIFLLAGFDTSGTALALIIYELAFQPEIQNKLYEELKGFGKEDLEVTKLAEAVYLNCVIKELLRKVPPMGWIDRVALSDYKVDDNLVIPAGTPVYINANGMHYDRDYFPDPESFNPDRFLPENEIKQFTYLPFGEGPRICIGQRFALVSMRHALTKLVLNFTFKALPGTPKPSEIEFEKRGLFLNPAEHLYVDFIPRDIKT